MASLSTATWTALLSQQTSAAFIVLLRISIDELDDGNWKCIYLCKNSEDIVSNVADGVTDQTYVAWPFEIVLPKSESGKISNVQFSISNVSRALVDYVNNLVKPMLVTMTIINSAEPNVAIRTYPSYIWRSITTTPSTISGTISLENFLNEPYPGDLMAPYNFPGLFS